MTGNIDKVSHDRLKQLTLELGTQLAQMQPLLKQMHLLSSNAVSAAARAGSEGDAFRVLTQAIQALVQEISQDLQQAQLHLQALLAADSFATAKSHLKSLTDSLSAMPQAVKKGEYLAICSAVEAAHATNFGDSFDSVAVMLKALISDLRQQVVTQQHLLDKLK